MSLSSKTVSFGVSSDVFTLIVPPLDAVTKDLPSRRGVFQQLLDPVHVSRGHSLFLQGLSWAHIRKWSCGYAVRGCMIVFWAGSVCFWNGTDYTRPHLCVTVRDHVLVIVRVVGDSVSELSPLPQLSVSAQHSKVHNPIFLLLLFAILKACFR